MEVLMQKQDSIRGLVVNVVSNSKPKCLTRIKMATLSARIAGRSFFLRNYLLLIPLKRPEHSIIIHIFFGHLFDTVVPRNYLCFVSGVSTEL